MKKEKKEVKNEENKMKRIIVPIITLIILSLICVLFFVLKQNKSYEIEVITRFSYFKLYENEKYGVIDNKRKYISRTKI